MNRSPCLSISSNICQHIVIHRTDHITRLKYRKPRWEFYWGYNVHHSLQHGHVEKMKKKKNILGPKSEVCPEGDTRRKIMKSLKSRLDSLRNISLHSTFHGNLTINLFYLICNCNLLSLRETVDESSFSVQTPKLIFWRAWITTWHFFEVGTRKEVKGLRSQPLGALNIH